MACLELNDEIVREQRIAKICDVDVRTVQAWRLRGCGPPFLKLQRAVRYSLRDVMNWLENNRRQSTSEGEKGL